ncbi:MED19 family protein [Megaselia abdita]
MMNFGVGEFRKMESYSSPKSSPRGGRSPVVSRQDSSGTLKTTISLGKNPTIVHSGPFYLMKEPSGEAEITGATNLMAHYGLEHSYGKFSGKKVKEQLSTFLPNLPGCDGMPNMENSTLRSVIEKPPIGGKELHMLSSVQLAGFRLHPGPLPEQYRTLNTTPARKNKNKQKKAKNKDGTPLQDNASQADGVGGLEAAHEKKHKKQKRHEDDKERKKRKKEKKRKKQRHSPEPGTLGATGGVIGVPGPSNLGMPTSVGGIGGPMGGNLMMPTQTSMF